jgi:quinol monooxygenase YgiN
MFSWINSENIYSTPPSVHNISIFQDTGFHFVKSALKSTPDPYIVVTEATFKEGLAQQSAPFWKELVSVSQKESGTLAFGVYTESDKPNKIFTFEAYESEKYLTDVLSKTSAYTENDEALKNSTTVLVRTPLQVKGGFLYKEGAFS